MFRVSVLITVPGSGPVETGKTDTIGVDIGELLLFLVQDRSTMAIKKVMTAIKTDFIKSGNANWESCLKRPNYR